MGRISSVILVLFCSLQAAAGQEVENFLFQADPGPYCSITAVYQSSTGKSAAAVRHSFGHAGGRIDIPAGLVVGNAPDGSRISVPLHEVSRLKIRFERSGRTYEYHARLDRLRENSNWPPPGRIQKVLLTAGVTIDFSLVGPGVDLADGSLFWSCKDESVARIPFEDIALVQIKPNSFVTDPNDLAEYCAVAEMDLISGEELAVTGLSGGWDQAEEVIRFDGREVSLAEVRTVRVEDCRTRAFAEPVEVVQEPEASEEGTLEIYDFEKVALTGRRVRYRDTHGFGRWVKGTVVVQDASGLEIQTGEETVLVPLDAIEKLEVSQGRSGNSGTGALIGGAIVGAAGLGLGLAMQSDSFFDTSTGDIVAATFLGVGVGAAVGGLIGWAVKTEQWEDVEKIQINPIVAPDKSPGLAVSWEF